MREFLANAGIPSLIDTVVTVLGDISHFWDNRCTVAAMAKKIAMATIRVVDHDVAEHPRPDDLAKLSAPLTALLTAELDEAHRYLRVPTDEILLGALGRTIARTLGTGDLDVDVAAYGGLTMSLACTSARRVSASKALRAVHHGAAASRHQMPSAADVHFVFTDSAPEPAYRQAMPTGGHALELRVYRDGDRLQMDWWYDTRRLDCYTVEELTEQFPLALIELTSEATPLESAEIGDTDREVLAGSV
jgi:hypothetical protein